tara:strand:- start:158 stop:334 length:177 start_codon:yes stop_codon:yes gene_type:complete
MLKNILSQNLIYGLLIGAVVGMIFFDNLAMGAAVGVLFGLVIKNTKEHYEKKNKDSTS